MLVQFTYVVLSFYSIIYSIYHLISSSYKVLKFAIIQTYKTTYIKAYTSTYH